MRKMEDFAILIFAGEEVRVQLRSQILKLVPKGRRCVPVGLVALVPVALIILSCSVLQDLCYFQDRERRQQISPGLSLVVLGELL